MLEINFLNSNNIQPLSVIDTVIQLLFSFLKNICEENLNLP